MLKVTLGLCFVAVVWARPPVSRSRKEIEDFKTYLERTKNGKGVVLPHHNPASSAWVQSGKYQGDILLDEHQIQSMVEQYASGRHAYIWPDSKWPDNTVVYEIAAGNFTLSQTNAILNVIDQIAAMTCIKFRQRTPQDVNYVLVGGGIGGCWAHIGFWAPRGVHVMNLGLHCFNPVIIAHEWFHIIGFFHMHATYNRDEYVKINWENIIPGEEYNFDSHGPEFVSNLGLPYEYDSCMHYGPYDFTVNGRATITALQEFDGYMGQTSYITAYDWLRVDRHYGCSPWKTVDDYKTVYFDIEK